MRHSHSSLYYKTGTFVTLKTSEPLQVNVEQIGRSNRCLGIKAVIYVPTHTQIGCVQYLLYKMITLRFACAFLKKRYVFFIFNAYPLYSPLLHDLKFCILASLIRCTFTLLGKIVAKLDLVASNDKCHFRKVRLYWRSLFSYTTRAVLYKPIIAL